MREARAKLRLIRPEDMDMEEYMVQSLFFFLLNPVSIIYFFIFRRCCDKMFGINFSGHLFLYVCFFGTHATLVGMKVFFQYMK